MFGAKGWINPFRGYINLGKGGGDILFSRLSLCHCPMYIVNLSLSNVYCQLEGNFGLKFGYIDMIYRGKG